MGAKNTVKPGRKPGSNAVRGEVNVGDVTRLPDEKDLHFLHSKALPPPSDGRVVHDTFSAFTPSAIAALREDAVARFFGSRLDPHKVATWAEDAAEAEAVSQRLAHAADRARQIAAPLNASLFDVAALIVRDWDAVCAQFPDAAAQLQPIHDWWTATHPGGGPRQNGSANPPPPANPPQKPQPTPA